jgi:hypothetical protein
VAPPGGRAAWLLAQRDGGCHDRLSPRHASSESVLRLNVHAAETYRLSGRRPSIGGAGMSQWSPREAIIMERRHISEGEKRIARQEARVAEVTERGYSQVADRCREVLSILRQSLELTRAARLRDLEARYPDAATSC